jgi:hypothetical protein
MGVTTHAPEQARTCPHRNAFGTPEAGVLSSGHPVLKLSVSFWTAAKARKLGFRQRDIAIRFVSERGDYTTNPKGVQAISGSHFRQPIRAARKPGAETLESQRGGTKAAFRIP